MIQCRGIQLSRLDWPLEFPPLLLELGLQIYGGPRLLSAENSVSPGIIPTVGLLQGCPHCSSRVQACAPYAFAAATPKWANT